MKKNVKIILASASPRRKQLLEALGWKFQIIPSDLNETTVPGEPPEEMVMRLARLKGSQISEEHPDALVISSDTTVAIDGKIFGKPKDDADALSMLQTLSGRSHHVFTGLALFWDGRCLCECDCAEVTFRKMPDDALRAYTASGEHLGKAGAYAMQGSGGVMVEKICGDYSTVVGLPLCLLGKMMEKLNFPLSEIWGCQN